MMLFKFFRFIIFLKEINFNGKRRKSVSDLTRLLQNNYCYFFSRTFGHFHNQHLLLGGIKGSSRSRPNGHSSSCFCWGIVER